MSVKFLFDDMILGKNLHFLSVTIQGHQYETVSGFVCEVFGYIPRTGETMKVVLEREELEEHHDYNGGESDRTDKIEKNQIFKLEVYFLPLLSSLLLKHFKKYIYN